MSVSTANRLAIDQLCHSDAPGPNASLLDLPSELLPKIGQRLPGADLLQLARVCRHTLNQGQQMRAAWASQELREISSLGEREFWTRFLGLAKNCGMLIDPDDWQTFLSAAEARHEGYAQLLQLAVLTPALGKVNQAILSDACLPPKGMLGKKENAVLSAVLSDSAQSDPMMATVAAAVTAGFWQHTVRRNHAASWSGFESAFLSFFLSLGSNAQMEIMPFLTLENASHEALHRIYGRTASLHAQILLCDFTHPSHLYSKLLNARKLYLECINKMFLSSGRSMVPRIALQMLQDALIRNLRAPIGPWRDQRHELALFMFLALQWRGGCEQQRATLEEELIKQGFISRKECSDFFRFLAEGNSGSTAPKVLEWLSSNRYRTAETHSEAKPETVQEASCSIS